MRRFVPAIVTCVLFAFSAMAEDGYRFHIKVTDGRTGLLANPRFEELKMPAEQLERAAKQRVMVLDHTTGTHWIWLMLSCPRTGRP